MSSEPNEFGRCDASPTGGGHEKMGFDEEEDEDVDICHECSAHADPVYDLPVETRASPLMDPTVPSDYCDGRCCWNPWPNRTGSL